MMLNGEAVGTISSTLNLAWLFTVWPIDSGVISDRGDTLTFNIVHEDTAFPGTTFVAPFNTGATATVSKTEMHLRTRREDNGTSGEMTLLGPIRLRATR